LARDQGERLDLVGARACLRAELLLRARELLPQIAHARALLDLADVLLARDLKQAVANGLKALAPLLPKARLECRQPMHEGIDVAFALVGEDPRNELTHAVGDVGSGPLVLKHLPDVIIIADRRDYFPERRNERPLPFLEELSECDPFGWRVRGETRHRKNGTD
jgi:hypothetical protein